MNKAFRVACMLSRFSRVRLFATLWTVARQAPLSRGFSRQDYWSGLSCPSPGDLPDPGVEPSLLGPLHWQAGSLALQPPGKPRVWGAFGVIIYKVGPPRAKWRETCSRPQVLRSWWGCFSPSVVSNSCDPVACNLQTPLSLGFSRQEYWSGLPFPSPGVCSPPRDQTQVSCITGGFFTIWIRVPVNL